MPQRLIGDILRGQMRGFGHFVKGSTQIERRARARQRQVDSNAAAVVRASGRIGNIARIRAGAPQRVLGFRRSIGIVNAQTIAKAAGKRRRRAQACHRIGVKIGSRLAIDRLTGDIVACAVNKRQLYCGVKAA